MIETMSKLRNGSKTAAARHGPRATIEETAKAANIQRRGDAARVKISRHPISLDRPVGESEEATRRLHRGRQRESPVQAATQESLKDKIDQVLKTLTYVSVRSSSCVTGWRRLHLHAEEVGRIFKVTRERVRQIEAKAVRKLQTPYAADSLRASR